MPEKHPSTEPYPPELERRAVRMVQETIEQNNGEQFGVVGRVARQLRIGEESGSSRRRLLPSVAISDRSRTARPSSQCAIGHATITVSIASSTNGRPSIFLWPVCRQARLTQTGIHG